jgi:hypothetical protein
LPSSPLRVTTDGRRPHTPCSGLEHKLLCRQTGLLLLTKTAPPRSTQHHEVLLRHPGHRDRGHGHFGLCCGRVLDAGEAHHHHDHAHIMHAPSSPQRARTPHHNVECPDCRDWEEKSAKGWTWMLKCFRLQTRNLQPTTDGDRHVNVTASRCIDAASEKQAECGLALQRDCRAELERMLSQKQGRLTFMGRTFARSRRNTQRHSHCLAPCAGSRLLGQGNRRGWGLLLCRWLGGSL